MPSFSVAHISDLHLPASWSPAGLRELVSKRVLSRLAWRRKRRHHAFDVLSALIADVAAHTPDHVAVTGDLTNFSTPEEFVRAQHWLESLGSPHDVTVSPGNHDALVARGLGERLQGLRDWFGDPGEDDFPHVRRRGPVALINLCSALATPPLMATGRLGRAQLASLAEVLAAEGREGRVRIVLLHHPVVAGLVSGRKALTDAAELQAVLKRHGADLVLHGHVHASTFGAVEGPLGPIPVLGAPSASSTGDRHEPAGWNAIEVETDGPVPSFRIVARRFDPPSGTVRELGRYRLPGAEAGVDRIGAPLPAATF